MVLLVEDNAELNQYLTKVLSKTYKVVNSVNGEEGLAYTSRLMPEAMRKCENKSPDKPYTSHPVYRSF